MFPPWLTDVAAGETLQRVLARKTLVAVVDPSYPPFSFLNDKNLIDGFDIDIARAVAKKLGVSLRTETPSWEIIAAGHWRGRWDVCICSMTPDQQKVRVLDFVAPYYASPAVIVTTAVNNQLNSPGDLTGKKIGVQQGSSYERYLQHDLDLGVAGGNKLTYLFKQVRIAPYASEDMAFQDLALGAGKRIGRLPFPTRLRRNIAWPGFPENFGSLASRCIRNRTGSPSIKAMRNGDSRLAPYSPV